MLDTLQAKNPDFPIASVHSDAFRTFGRVITDLDTTEIVRVAAATPLPTEGSVYQPSNAALEGLSIASDIRNRYFGTLPTQIGYCFGHNTALNAAEWHSSNEINVAVTPLVLFLGHVWDLQDDRISSEQFTCFYLPQGAAVEVYATTLHFCPCEVQRGGFGCVVALPRDTNTDLEIPSEDRKLFRKNKWILAHDQNRALIERGVPAGIGGINYSLKY